MKNELIVTINFDDFHPESVQYDFGGLGGKVLDRLLNLNARFGLKMTMFTVPNWQDIPYSPSMRVLRRLDLDKGFRMIEEPFHLGKHEKWCSKINELIDEGIIEIAHHGYTHFNEKKGLHQQEFIGLSKDDVRNRLEEMVGIYKEVGIKTVPIFRPPGFGFNEHLVPALEEQGFKAIAPFPSWYALSGNAKMGSLKVLEGAVSIRSPYLHRSPKDSEIHFKGHCEANYGPERIENGISDNEIFFRLIERLNWMKKRFEFVPKFCSEVAGL